MLTSVLSLFFWNEDTATIANEGPGTRTACIVIKGEIMATENIVEGGIGTRSGTVTGSMGTGMGSPW